MKQVTVGNVVFGGGELAFTLLRSGARYLVPTPPPESLSAALRLITDSTKSDTMAIAATGAAMSAA